MVAALDGSERRTPVRVRELMAVLASMDPERPVRVLEDDHDEDVMNHERSTGERPEYDAECDPDGVLVVPTAHHVWIRNVWGS
jgi:hypothetical protein